MNDVYNKMLSSYDCSTEQRKRNAIYEVNQQIVLAGLYRGVFFDNAAFYGGTCLRIFHGLNRFSEDMDFSLLTPDEDFKFERYFPYIIDEFSVVGRKVECHHLRAADVLSRGQHPCYPHAELQPQRIVSLVKQ